jgi:hypothetical protein
MQLDAMRNIMCHVAWNTIPCDTINTNSILEMAGVALLNTTLCILEFTEMRNKAIRMNMMCREHVAF